MFNLAAPTLPLNGGVLADLKLPVATIPAESGGFADVLALQSGLEQIFPVPAAITPPVFTSQLPESEAATALPASGNILPVAVAVLPVAVSEVPPPVPNPIASAKLPVPLTAVSQPAAEGVVEAQPQAQAQPQPQAQAQPQAQPQKAPVLPALRIKPGAPEVARGPAKAAGPDVSRVMRDKPEELPLPGAEQPVVLAVADPVAAPVLDPIAPAQVEKADPAIPLTLPVLPALVIKQEAAPDQPVPAQTPSAGQQPFAAMPQPIVLPLAAKKLPEQPRPQTSQTLQAPAAPVPTVEAPVRIIPALAEQLAAAPVAAADAPPRITPAKAEQAAAPVAVASAFAEAAPAVSLTPIRLRAPQARGAMPTETGALQTAQPLTAPIAPMLAEPVAGPLVQARGAERPVDFAQLVDRLVAAREAASPQPVSLAVHHADFGKVSLRFESDGGALNVAMSAADPDFARAVAVAAPQQAAQTGNEALPQRSQSEQQPSTGQSPSQQQSSSQPKGAEPRSAGRTQTANPSSEGSDERPTARRGLFA